MRVLRIAGLALAVLVPVLPVHAAEPVNLTVGYQPYDTISYSAVVIRGLELWKKHLPADSTVDFQAALQGAIAVALHAARTMLLSHGGGSRDGSTDRNWKAKVQSA